MISPADKKTKGMAVKSLLQRLSRQKATGQRDWTRNELYGEEHARRAGCQHSGVYAEGIGDAGRTDA